jgi:hypothetical protein
VSPAPEGSLGSPRTRAALALPGPLPSPATGARATAPRTVRTEGRRAASAPFPPALSDHGRPVTAEAGGTAAGPGGRLPYQAGGPATSQDGATYQRLTNLIAHRPTRGGTAYDADTVRRFRDAVVLHYALVPSLYEAARTGVPILRAVGYQCPAGQWVDLYGGQVATVGRTVARDTGLEEVPLSPRAGAAIGLGDRSLGGWGTGEPSRRCLSGWMYAPGPGAAQAIGSGRGRLSASTSGETVCPRLGDARVLTGRVAASVTVNGRSLPHVAGLDARRGLAEGRACTAGAFGGVVFTTTSRRGSAGLTMAGPSMRCLAIRLNDARRIR